MNEKLQELGREGKSSDEVNPDKNAPDFGFYVADMTGKQWLATIGELGSNVWENAALPENYWNEDKGSKTSNVRMPALFTGVADGAIGLISDYPQLIKLGYDVATKSEVRRGLWDGIKSITPGKIYDFAEGAVKDRISQYNFSDKPYLGYHQIGKDGVIVVKMVAGGGLVSGIKDVGEKFSKKAVKKVFKDAEELVKDIASKRGFIRANIINTSETKELARLYAKKADIPDKDFDNWFKNSFSATEKGTVNFQAHHVIPIEILEKNDKLNALLFRLQEKADFDFNGLDNGMMLQAKSLNIDVAGHAKHNEYSLAIDKKVTEICASKLDDIDKLNKIKELIAKTKETLKNEVLLGNKDVNDITNL
jgi:hypothetical protein